MRVFSSILIVGLGLAGFYAYNGFAAYQSSQTKPLPQELYGEIVYMDSVLFDAFNKRDLETFKSLLSHDLEFFHDEAGLSTYKQNIESTKNLFNQNNDLRRELVPGSLEVYPVKDYGAIQIGAHTFCHTENGHKDCGTFKFLHIWQKQNGTWKLSRVVSYGH